MISNKAVSGSLRILIIRNAWALGGAERYALNLSSYLKDNGHKPVLVSNVTEVLSSAQSIGIPSIKGKWNLKQNWGYNYLPRAVYMICWYALIISRQKIDVVHAQGRDDFLFATAAARLLGKPIIWTDHGDLKYIVNPGASRSLRLPLLFLAKRTRAVIAVSESEKTEILAGDPTFPNLVVVHNGVLPLVGYSAHDKTTKYVVGSTSRLVKAKGIEELIRGFANIKLVNDTALWLVGDGEDRDYFMRLAKSLGVSKQIVFFGFQSDVWPLLSAMDVFAQVSHHEAFCLSIIEAAMVGLPILATNTGGTPEIVDDEIGRLVQVGDSAAITTSLNELLGNSGLRKKLGSAAKARALKDFNFNKIVQEKMMPLYRGSR